MLDLRLECVDVCPGFGHGPWWRVDVELAGERDLVADSGFVVVDPGIGHVWVDLFGEVFLGGLADGLDPFLIVEVEVASRERDILLVAQVRVGLVTVGPSLP